MRLIDRSNNQELLLYFTKSKLIVVRKQFVVGILIFGLGHKKIQTFEIIMVCLVMFARMILRNQFLRAIF